MNELPTEEFIMPKKKTKCSLQGKRNTTRSSTNALGNKQSKSFIIS